MAGSVSKRNGKWLARYRPVPGGPQVTKTFARKVDGERWLDEQTALLVTGHYVAPRAGNVTFKEYAEHWRKARPHRPSSVLHVETMLRRHAYPTFGDRPLKSILPSDVQAWATGLGVQAGKRKPLAPSTIAVVHGLVAAVFKAAVKDKRLTESPCVDTKLPKEEPKQVVPPTTKQVRALADAVPDRYRALVLLAAGTGLRQGEAFGLTVDRVDFLRRTVKVDRQLVQLVGGPPTFGPPKTKASHRTVPLPQVVAEALAEHLRTFGAGQDGLLFSTATGEPLRRTSFSANVWRPAVKRAGVEGLVFHSLRHYYASLLIHHGESVKVVQSRLGHATAAETLDTYSHLWPDSEDQTRAAIDSALGAEDNLRTRGAAEG